MLLLRKINLADLNQWQLPHHEYHLFNGPYFLKANRLEAELLIEEIRHKLLLGVNDPMPQKRLICNDQNELIGEVNWYWKSKETFWMERVLLFII